MGFLSPVKHERNRSLTKGEIEAFWRARKGTAEEEEHAAVASTYRVSQARPVIEETMKHGFHIGFLVKRLINGY